MSHRAHPTSPNAQQKVVTFAPNTWQLGNSRPVSRTSSRAPSAEPALASAKPSNGYTNGKAKASRLDEEGFNDLDSDSDEMGDRRPPLHRPTDGRSHQPLLHKEDDEERGRTGYDASPDPPQRPPLFTRSSTMRSRSPDTQAKLATRKKYTYAAFFLGLSLISFVVQTETAVYIQHELGWNKAYCML
jgi:hypothetical protein